MVTIRRLRSSDAPQAAVLSSELGYAVSDDVMLKRIQALSSSCDHVVFAAVDSNDVAVGWIDVGIVSHLQSDPYGEIGGLVVASDYRSRGIGQLLVSKAERWIAANGIRKVLVRSQVSRKRAHTFYLRLAFEHVKTSAVFMKTLRDEPEP